MSVVCSITTTNNRKNNEMIVWLVVEKFTYAQVKNLFHNESIITEEFQNEAGCNIVF